MRVQRFWFITSQINYSSIPHKLRKNIIGKIAPYTFCLSLSLRSCLAGVSKSCRLHTWVLIPSMQSRLGKGMNDYGQVFICQERMESSGPVETILLPAAVRWELSILQEHIDAMTCTSASSLSSFSQTPAVVNQGLCSSPVLPCSV